MVDHIIVHSTHIKEKLLKKFPKEKITVISHGHYGFIDNQNYTRDEARKILKIKKDTFVVLSFGTIREYKGLKYLIDAVRTMKNTKLIIAGESWPEMKDYMQKIKKEPFLILEDKNVPTKEIELYFKASDVAAYPYIRITTSGAIMVAMMLKTPIVATKVDSMQEIVGGVAALTKSKSPKSIKKALEYLQKNPQVREKLANRAYKRAKEDYSWENSAKKTRTIYNYCIRIYTRIYCNF